jgi:UDP-3-O-[3-hydroxymyristoyl] glucosamine N-acyltransferase
MQISVQELAAVVNGRVEGDGQTLVDHPAKIEEAGPGSVTFLGNMKYESYAYQTQASALLVAESFQPKAPVQPTLIRVENVYTAVSQLLEAFDSPRFAGEKHLSERAAIAADVEIGNEVRIGDFTVVEPGVRIGAGTVIAHQCYLGENVVIGKNCLIYPGVKVLRNCQIGDGCILHANAVIGSDGFGFAPDAAGQYAKVPQLGNVILEQKVEVGANTTIDRATMGSTIIRAGVKLDNLIQIGHNVEIGRDTVVAAQTGIAGSTKVGARCRIGGQVGLAGHLTIADGTQIQAQSGIPSSVTESGRALFGTPAIAYRDYIRSYGVFKKLPELYRQIGRLQQALDDLRRKQE